MRADRKVRCPSPGRDRGNLPPGDQGSGLGATESVPGAKNSVDSAKPESTEPDGLGLLLKQIQELREYVSYYVAAKTDAVRCSAQNAARRVVLAVLSLVGVGSLIVLGTWFVLSGTAQGLGTLFGDKPWIGTLLSGIAALTGVVTGVQVLAAVHRKSDRRKVVEKYESRRASQRARFGRVVRP